MALMYQIEQRLPRDRVWIRRGPANLTLTQAVLGVRLAQPLTLSLGLKLRIVETRDYQKEMKDGN